MEPLPPAGRSVAGWRLLRLVGQGAHGAVYLAEGPAQPAPVALKLVPLNLGGDAQRAAALFMHSANAARALVHPGIVALYAAGVEGALGWLAMEPVLGGDLSRYTQASRLLPEPLVLQVAARLASALSYAHRQGIVHRDLKPANVLVHWPSDSVKLADFGLARAADAVQTGTGVVMGSPAYMAPEQLAGNVPTPGTDLYALGVMLYQLLAARLPHEADTMGELLRQVAHDEPTPLVNLRPQLPAGVAVLVARLLAKRAADRPGDAAVVAEELQHLAHAAPFDG